MSIVHLGIDPGHDGAAVILDEAGRRCLAVWSWHRLRRKGRDVYATWSTDEGNTTEKSLGEIGMWIASGMAGHHTLTVEGLYGRAIALAEACGEVMGPLVASALNDVREGRYRPRAQVWRKAVLGSAPSKAAAKELARRLAPRLIEGIPDDLLEVEHVVEAACIARYGAKQWAVTASRRG